MTPLENRPRTNENLAFCIAPLVSTIPLIPSFSLPSSPLFLGKLMGDPATNPFLLPQWGPWLAAAGVVFDGTLLAYFIAVLLYLILLGSGRPQRDLLKPAGELSIVRVLILFSLAGVFASQFVHLVQGFRQPALRDFATSWLSPLFGCLCGLASGGCFALFQNRRFSPAARVVVYALPVAVVGACGSILVWSAQMPRVR